MKAICITILRLLLPKSVFDYIKYLAEQRDRIDSLNFTAHNLVLANYAKLHSSSSVKAKLKMAEAKIYSQFGEDGILLSIFSKINSKAHSFVEIGISNGVESNAANFAINLEWGGLFIDSSIDSINEARNYFINQKLLDSSKLKLVATLVTPRNINTLLKTNRVGREIDLLSIDIDGNDYWVWKALKSTHPRVVIIEYNASYGLRSVSSVYSKHFDRYKKHPSGLYHGASLTALTKLAHSKGYILAGCESHGANAIFVRKDVAIKKIDEMKPSEAFYPLSLRNKLGTIEDQFNTIRTMKFVKV